jgi:universal stress protein E
MEVHMSTSIRSIAVGIATVSEPDPMLRTAVDLAEAIGATLHLVHAHELSDPLLQAYARDGYLGTGFGESQRERLRARLQEQLRDLSHERAIHCHVELGSASEVLCEQADRLGADLLLVGATRSGRLLSTVLGSTAEKVLRRAHVPVLVLREPIVHQRGRVLITGDLSDFSAGVHQRGIRLASALFPNGAPELRSLLVVWHDLALPTPVAHADILQQAEVELHDFLTSLAPALHCEARVRVGDPAREIAAEVTQWPADLLVLGTHGRTGAARFLLGSVAEATLRGTRGNVLVIPVEPPARATEAIDGSMEATADV